MSKEELEKAMAIFQANGGAVQQVKEGERTVDARLLYCDCGCNGNYTEHSMRLGERGIYR